MIHDYDSLQNDTIKDAFIEKHVYGCLTAEVEFILSQHYSEDAPFCYDDISNYYSHYCEDCGRDYTSWTMSIDDAGETIYICDDCGRAFSISEYSGLDVQPNEIYGWWFVSQFLAEKLAERGECVIDAPCGYYWGRGCSGQLISSDHVISKICEDLQILAGQQYSWEKTTA